MRNLDDEFKNLFAKENVLNVIDEIDKLTETQINALLNHIIERDKPMDLSSGRSIVQEAIEEISPRDRLKDEIRSGRIFFNEGL